MKTQVPKQSSRQISRQHSVKTFRKTPGRLAAALACIGLLLGVSPLFAQVNNTIIGNDLTVLPAQTDAVQPQSQTTAPAPATVQTQDQTATQTTDVGIVDASAAQLPLVELGYIKKKQYVGLDRQNGVYKLSVPVFSDSEIAVYTLTRDNATAFAAALEKYRQWSDMARTNNEKVEKQISEITDLSAVFVKNERTYTALPSGIVTFTFTSMAKPETPVLRISFAPLESADFRGTLIALPTVSLTEADIAAVLTLISEDYATQKQTETEEQESIADKYI